MVKYLNAISIIPVHILTPNKKMCKRKFKTPNEHGKIRNYVGLVRMKIHEFMWFVDLMKIPMNVVFFRELYVFNSWTIVHTFEQNNNKFDCTTYLILKCQLC